MAVMYPIIKKYIVDEIKNGNYTEESMLPAEREFTDRFQVSRMTVRRAFDELIQDGILIRKSGTGVFVAPQKQTKSYDKLSFKNDTELIEKYGKITTKVISLKLVTNHQLVNKYLELENDEEVYQLKRVQYGGNIPLVYENIFLPKKYFKNIFKVDCTQSMQEIIKETLLEKKPQHNIIEVEASSVSRLLGATLQLPQGAIIMKLTNIVMSEGKAIYFGVDSIDGNRFKYISKN